MGNNMYVYQENDITTEALYLKKKLVAFIKDLGYFRGGTPVEEFEKKRVTPYSPSLC